MGRDFRAAKASFKGAQFYVDRDAFDEGHRIARHEYPNASGSDVAYDLENLGLKVGSIQVTAYFASETADQDAQALRTALIDEQPGTLMVPMFGAVQCRAETWAPSWEQTKLNFVGFSVTFLLEASNYQNGSSGFGGSPPSGLGEREIADMLTGLPLILSTSLSAAFAISPDPPFDLSDSIAAADTIAGMADVARTLPGVSDPVSLATAGTITSAIATIETGDEVAVGLGRVYAALDTLSAAAQGLTDGSILISGMATALTSYAGATAVPTAGAVAPLTWASAAVMFGAEAAGLVATQPFTDREAAIAARVQIAAIADDVALAYDDLGPDATAAFDALIARASRHVSDQVADLAPIVIVQVARSLPASVLAYRLYGDPDRGDELVNRNKVATPAIMPQRLTALAT